MHKKRMILINIIFIILTVFFLVLSLILNFIFLIPFFFLPIICWLPFLFKGRRRDKAAHESFYEPYVQALRRCPICRGEIKEPIAKFCYHCGAKLNNDEMR